MLKEAMVILPNHPAYEAAHTALQGELLTIWGGFTAVDGKGGWRAPNGANLVEPVTCYAVAMADTQANADVFEEVALRAGRAARQETVYVRFANGNVDIIDTHAFEEAA